MNSHKTSTVVYALGFIEDFVENNTESLEIKENATDEQATATSNENEYRDQVTAMWRVLEAGVRQLLAENGRLQNKITMAEMALKG